MANNEVRVDFKDMTGSGFQKMNSHADRLNTLKKILTTLGKNRRSAVIWVSARVLPQRFTRQLLRSRNQCKNSPRRFKSFLL